MRRDLSISLRFDLAIGKVNLNEIVYRLKEIRDEVMLRILAEVLKGYDDLIVERLSRTDVYPSKARKGLGRHIRRDDPGGHFCRGRKVHKRGYRQRKIRSIFGSFNFRVRVAECLRCGGRYCPGLNALGVEAYCRKVHRYFSGRHP